MFRRLQQQRATGTLREALGEELIGLLAATEREQRLGEPAPYERIAWLDRERGAQIRDGFLRATERQQRVRAFVPSPGEPRRTRDRTGQHLERLGMGALRVMTDFCADRYWMLVAEFEVASLADFEQMDSRMSEADAREFERVMQGYHDLVESGRREIYKLEG